MNITLHGRVPSKKNSKRIAYAGHRPIIISSKDYEVWHTIASFELVAECRKGGFKDMLIGPLRISMTMFGENKRLFDLTNKAESVMDLLVDNFIIKDDNWKEIPEILLKFGEVDTKNPRVEIEIVPFLVAH